MNGWGISHSIKILYVTVLETVGYKNDMKIIKFGIMEYFKRTVKLNQRKCYLERVTISLLHVQFLYTTESVLIRCVVGHYIKANTCI